MYSFYVFMKKAARAIVHLTGGLLQAVMLKKLSKGEGTTMAKCWTGNQEISSVSDQLLNLVRDRASPFDIFFSMIAYRRPPAKMNYCPGGFFLEQMERVCHLNPLD